jgi:beta-lactamase regulating signal transducer with metallopeptidase domain
MIDTLIKATILLTVVALAAHLLRRRSAALRHLLWTLAIVGLVALPVLTAIVPFRLPILPARSAPAVSERTRAPDPSPPTRVAEAPRREATPSTSAPMTRTAENASTTAPARSPIDLPRVLFFAWLAVALVMLARIAIGWVIVSGISRRAVPITDDDWWAQADRAARALNVRAPVDLRRSDDVAMPFACGLLTPVIVLPTSSSEWTLERRQAVLMHEFAHLSRGDLAMNMLSHTVRALYWFHPLAWLAAYRLRVEGERSCDDAVLRAGALPSDYAEHLLSIVRTVGNSVPSVALAMARRSDFEGRLLAILEPGVPRNRLTRMRVAGLAALFLVAVMPLAAMTPSAAAPAPEPVEPTPLASPVPSEASAPRTASVKMLPQVPERPPTVSQGTEQAGSALTALIETLGDANAAVRLAAVSSLGSLGDPKAIAALVKALREDSDARVREAAAEALGEIDDVRAVAPLLEALKAERASNVREQIVRALGEIDDPSAVQGISAVVKDSSVGVRRAAVSALGELDDPSAVPALLSMVKDDDVEVRRHVAEALGELENKSAIDPLMALARDPDAIRTRRSARTRSRR